MKKCRTCGIYCMSNLCNDCIKEGYKLIKVEIKKGPYIHHMKSRFGHTELEVDNYYYLNLRGVLNNRCVRFVRATTKGFNFLDEERGCYIFPKRHLYAKGYGGVPLPAEKKKFTFLIPSDISLYQVVCDVCDTADI